MYTGFLRTVMDVFYSVSCYQSWLMSMCDQNERIFLLNASHIDIKMGSYAVSSNVWHAELISQKECSSLHPVIYDWALSLWLFSVKQSPVWTPRPIKYQIAFYAGLSKSIEAKPVGKDCHLRFETVILNLGGGYNSSTGVFTAPVSGVYIFVVVISAQSYEKVSEIKKRTGTRRKDLVYFAFTHSVLKFLAICVSIKGWKAKQW